MDEEEKFALEKFESMLQSNKLYFFDSSEFEDIIQYYLDIGKIALANKALKLSLSQHPASISLKLIKVEVLILINKIAEAEKLLDFIENLDASFDEIYILRASILSKSNKHTEAIIQLQKGLEVTKNAVDIHALLGMEYLFLENFNESVCHFNICLKLDIEDYSALYNIVYCYDMLEEHDRSIDFLNEYIDTNPYSEIAWHQLGRQYQIVRKYKEAIKAFDYAILIDEFFIGAYLEKGKSLEALKKYEDAIANYMLTLELDDPTVFTYLQIANCYQELGKYKLAISYYHKAVEEDPMLDQAWLSLTSLYLDLEEGQKALHYIEKALEVEEDNTDFINRLAEISIRLNLFEEATFAFVKSIELGDKRLHVYLALCDVLHFIGDYDQVKEVLMDASKLYPKNIEIYYRYAGIFFLLKNNKQAIFYLEKALKIDFEYKEVIQNIFPEMFLREDVKELITKFNS